MPTITNDSYSVGTGVTVYAGRTAPAVIPLWLQGQPLNQWLQISGTSAADSLSSTVGMGERALNAYSGLVASSTGKVYVVAVGGHEDGNSNGAAVIDLGANTPAWSALFAGSMPNDLTGRPINVQYYPDGRPTSRHTYGYSHLVENDSAIVLGSLKFGWGAGTPTGPGYDVFDLATNDYRARYHYPDSPDGSPALAKDNAGNIWTGSGRKFTVSTKTWSLPGSGSLLRFPTSLDSVRNRIFAMQYGDGQGFDLNLGVQGRELDPTTGNSRTITFAAGAALTAFETAQPQYGSMDYCTVDGKFYFFHSGESSVAYVVTPDSASTVWAMARVTFAGAAPVVTNSQGQGTALSTRVRWIAGLGGFVGMWNSKSTLYFIRIA